MRGLGKVRLEQQVNGGTWTVRPPRARCGRTGRFTVDGQAESGRRATASRRRMAPAPRSPSTLADVTPTRLTRPSRVALPCSMRRLLVLAAPSRRSSPLGARRRFAIRPLRPSGRRLARLRAGHARRAARQARPDRRRPRPLHAPLERDRAVRGKKHWGQADAVLEGLHERGIAPVVTLYGAPRWANGGRAPNWAPTSGSTFAAFAARRRSAIPG